MQYLAPEGEDVGLDGAPGGPVVVEPRDAAVDLEGGHEEEAPLQRVGHRRAERVPARRRRPTRRRGHGSERARRRG